MNQTSTDTSASWRRSRSPFRRLEKIVSSFSPFERLLFAGFVAIAGIGALLAVGSINAAYLTTSEPVVEGVLTEGIVGFPRFVNPLLSVSDADRDLVALVYSGLMKASPDGTLEPDLAESVGVSEDRLAYTFVLRENAAFHDGTPVTADDVIFTIQAAKDPAIKSPRRANWDGVLVEKLDERTVRFTLSQPYGAFLSNATIGILPAHIWKGVSAEEFPFNQHNTQAIGSGPFQIDSIDRDRSGIPTRYTLKRNPDYALGGPYIEELELSFYVNEAAAFSAFQRNDIDAIGGLSPQISSRITERAAHKAPLARIFAVFLNQNLELFTHTEVRSALDRALDKEVLVEEVLAGEATPIDQPIPPGIIENTEGAEEPDTATSSAAAARGILENAGWEENEDGFYAKDGSVLSFSLATVNIPELVAAAEHLKAAWSDAGINVDLQLFDQSDLSQTVIRPRKYDALLFGEMVGRELDLFAFWHSSQRNDPGLNVALYANITADKALEEMRKSSSPEARAEHYRTFLEEIKADTPAVFLYAPTFTYYTPENVRGIKLALLSSPSDRYLNVHEWYIATKRIWHFFSD